MSENVSQAFLGLSIGCAKCHNHPLEKWTNDQYYAMANLFARVRVKTGEGGKRTLYLATRGDLIQPGRGVPQPPTPLDGEPLPIDSERDRREHLSQWLTSPDNPYFARAIANRVWAAYLGVGLVEPVDDLRLSNPASNEPLMTALSEYLIEQDFNLRALTRTILQSETYQRSSLPTGNNGADHRHYSRFYPRRLMAEVLLDCIAQVTEVPTRFTHVRTGLGAESKQTGEYPVGTRALQLQDSAVLSDFLKTFGRNDRDIVCECERSNTPSLTQVLHISNGTTVNDRLRATESCVERAFSTGRSPDALIEDAYLLTLARLPSERERNGLLEVFEAGLAENRSTEHARTVLEDLYWSLISCREFLFQH